MNNELPCRRFLDVIDPQDSALAAARRMQQRGVGCLVVIDHDRKPIGIITDRDLVLRVMANGQEADITEVEEVMSVHPLTATKDISAEDALHVMQQAAIRRLPIVGKSGELVGLVALDDILMSMAGEAKRVGDQLESETPEAALVAG